MAHAASMASHGRRETAEAKDRVVNPHTPPKFGCTVPGVDPTKPDHALNALRELKGAKFRKGASVGLHAIVIASEGALKAPGAVDALERGSLAWARSEFGQDSVAAWRVDTDEKVPHVDLFILPVFERRTKRGKLVREVSTKKALGSLAERRYSKFQDNVAKALSAEGLDVIRGEPKAITKREYLTPRQMHEREEALAEREEIGETALKEIKDMRAEVESALTDARKKEDRADRMFFAAVEIGNQRITPGNAPGDLHLHYPPKQKTWVRARIAPIWDWTENLARRVAEAIKAAVSAAKEEAIKIVDAAKTEAAAIKDEATRILTAAQSEIANARNQAMEIIHGASLEAGSIVNSARDEANALRERSAYLSQELDRIGKSLEAENLRKLTDKLASNSKRTPPDRGER